MQNEGCEIFMNETKFEDDVMEEKKFNPSLQTKGSTIPKTDEKKLIFLETISFSKTNGNHIIGIFMLVYFCFVKDDTKVTLDAPQIVCCTLQILKKN
jgi:hypothetical protein